MRVEYRVSFTDHDWVVADQHQPILSTYAEIYIECDGLENKGAVGQSGPSYTALKLVKHSSSTAMSHGLDFETQLEKFEDIIRSGIHPLVITFDGSPDEISHHQEVIKVGIHHFAKHNLDAVFTAEKAAEKATGRSASRVFRVERKMACQSKSGTQRLDPFQ